MDDHALTEELETLKKRQEKLEQELQNLENGLKAQHLELSKYYVRLCSHFHRPSTASMNLTVEDAISHHRPSHN